MAHLNEHYIVNEKYKHRSYINGNVWVIGHKATWVRTESKCYRHDISGHSAMVRPGLSLLRDLASKHVVSFGFYLLVSGTEMIILSPIALN